MNLLILHTARRLAAHRTNPNQAEALTPLGEEGSPNASIQDLTPFAVARLLDRPSPPLRKGTGPRSDDLIEAYRQTQAPLWSVVA